MLLRFPIRVVEVMKMYSVVKRSDFIGSSELILVQRRVKAIFLVHATFQKMLRKLPSTSDKGCLKNEQ